MTSLRKLLDIYAGELTVVEAELAARLAEHQGYTAIQAICGVGPIMAAIFVAEIGDVSRFPTARHIVLAARYFGACRFVIAATANQAGTLAPSPPGGYPAGMLAFMRKKFVGSYFALRAVRRAHCWSV